MLKGLGNLASMFKQAQELQGKMGEMREQLAHLRVEGSAGGGMVRVEANGQQNILSVHIDPSVIDDAEMLEDLLVASVNQALEKARTAAAQQMSDVVGDVNIPGLGEAMSKFGMGT